MCVPGSHKFQGPVGGGLEVCRIEGMVLVSKCLECVGVWNDRTVYTVVRKCI